MIVVGGDFDKMLFLLGFAALGRAKSLDVEEKAAKNEKELNELKQFLTETRIESLHE